MTGIKSANKVQASTGGIKRRDILFSELMEIW
jgi:hypothetical protein